MPFEADPATRREAVRDASIHRATAAGHMESQQQSKQPTTPDERTLPDTLESLRRLTGFVPPGSTEES